MHDWSQQLNWEDALPGTILPVVSFPLTIHRLVVHAGANKDFMPIHHNRESARAQGAPDMFANNVFVQGMWERAAREFIGLAGVLLKIGPFRMRAFIPVGETGQLVNSCNIRR